MNENTRPCGANKMALDALTEFEKTLTTWANAYPETVFPEPDLAKAAKILQAGGMTLDSISADAMRHIAKTMHADFADCRAAVAALQAEPQTEHCVDVHALLREAADQKAARTEQLPTEQDCISMMVQCRLRLLELGWTSGEYAPKDGKEFEGINPGFAGPSTYTHLGSGFFIASPGDWWPAPRPLVFRLPATPPKD